MTDKFEAFVRSLASVRASGGLGEIARSARELCAEVDAALRPWYQDHPPIEGPRVFPTPATETGRRSSGPSIRVSAPLDFAAVAERLAGSSWHAVVDGDGHLVSIAPVSPHERQVDGLVERHAGVEESVSGAIDELCDSLNEMSVARSAYQSATGCGDCAGECVTERADDLESAVKALAVDCCALVAALRRARR